MDTLGNIQNILISRFKNNLLYLKSKNLIPGDMYRLFANYQPQRYKIGFHPQNPKIADIIDMFTNTPFYSFNMESACEMQIKKPPVKTFSMEFDMAEMPTTDAILKNTILSQVSQPRPPKSGFYPFFVLYGIGSALILKRILQSYYIKHLFIYEPNLDFFYLSLYFTDYREILKIIETKQISLSLNINPDYEQLEKAFNDFLSQNFVMSAYVGIFFHTNNPQDEFLPAIERVYNTFFHGWWFFDHIKKELANSLKNLNGKSKILHLKEISPKCVFIVASGPSLDESIEIIRQNQDKAIIVACGTALKALVEAGIDVDFYVHLDPIHTTLDYIDKAKLNKITLLTHDNIVSPVKKYFDRIIYFFRHDSISRALFRVKDAVYNANPTITNASISLFLALGAKEIYLFGVDLASSGKKAHASNTVYTIKSEFFENENSVESSYTYKVPANFENDGFVFTSRAFSLAKRQIEDAIVHYNKSTKIFNCSKGAKISGTIAQDSKSLKLQAINKSKELENIYSLCYTKKSLDMPKKQELIENLSHTKTQVLFILSSINSLESFAKAMSSLHDFLFLSEQNLFEKNYLLFVRLDIFLILQKFYIMYLQNQIQSTKLLIDAVSAFFDEVISYIDSLK